MKPVLVSVTITDENGTLVTESLLSCRTKVLEIVSGGGSALIVVNAPQAASAHLECAKKYSKNLKDLKDEIKKANCLLVISALRAGGVPTHVKPLDSERKARKFLEKEERPLACVV